MKGLLFTPEMFLAVMTGRKTQHRRVVPGKLKQYEEGWSLNGKAPRLLPEDWCQYQPGEVVCMLTTWAVAREYDHLSPLSVAALRSDFGGGDRRIWLAGISPKPDWAGKSRPGRFLPDAMRSLMPRLKIGDVDVQRVQQISEAAAVAEGVVSPRYYVETDRDSSFQIDMASAMKVPAVGDVMTVGTLTKVEPVGAVQLFRKLWNSINAKRKKGWSRNPQVFAIKFSREVTA